MNITTLKVQKEDKQQKTQEKLFRNGWGSSTFITKENLNIKIGNEDPDNDRVLLKQHRTLPPRSK